MGILFSGASCFRCPLSADSAIVLTSQYLAPVHMKVSLKPNGNSVRCTMYITIMYSHKKVAYTVALRLDHEVARHIFGYILHTNSHSGFRVAWWRHAPISALSFTTTTQGFIRGWWIAWNNWFSEVICHKMWSVCRQVLSTFSTACAAQLQRHCRGRGRQEEHCSSMFSWVTWKLSNWM